MSDVHCGHEVPGANSCHRQERESEILVASGTQNQYRARLNREKDRRLKQETPRMDKDDLEIQFGSIERGRFRSLAQRRREQHSVGQNGAETSKIEARLPRGILHINDAEYGVQCQRQTTREYILHQPLYAASKSLREPATGFSTAMAFTVPD
jgi:hypothetical protein